MRLASSHTTPHQIQSTKVPAPAHPRSTDFITLSYVQVSSRPDCMLSSCSHTASDTDTPPRSQPQRCPPAPRRHRAPHGLHAQVCCRSQELLGPCHWGPPCHLFSRHLPTPPAAPSTDPSLNPPPQPLRPTPAQAQYDYLAGSYPVVKEDAAQMCALQIQAELGATLRGREDQLDALIEKYIVKQARPALTGTRCVTMRQPLAQAGSREVLPCGERQAASQLSSRSFAQQARSAVTLPAALRMLSRRRPAQDKSDWTQEARRVDTAPPSWRTDHAACRPPRDPSQWDCPRARVTVLRQPYLRTASHRVPLRALRACRCSCPGPGRRCVLIVADCASSALF